VRFLRAVTHEARRYATYLDTTTIANRVAVNKATILRDILTPMQVYEKLNELTDKIHSEAIGQADAESQIAQLIEDLQISNGPNSDLAISILRNAKSYMEEGSIGLANERLGAASRALRGSGSLTPNPAIHP